MVVAFARRIIPKAFRIKVPLESWNYQYLLSLELTDPGFDFSVLSEFRDRLLAGGAEERLLEKMLERCRARGLLTAPGQERSDSTHVLAPIRGLNRLEPLAENPPAAPNAEGT